MKPVWICMPAMANPELTKAALSDCLSQSVPTRVLLILQGIAGSWRAEMEQIAEQDDRLLIWSADPPLPSLAATWNRALAFVWATGAEEALVVNNDIRIAPWTVEYLRLILDDNVFLSAVGVTEDQYTAYLDRVSADWEACVDLSWKTKGGPDFSCFLIARAGHDKYLFDEAFIPAYGEDCDTHRRYMLGGDGTRIFSINLPYWHVGHGSNTLKTFDPEQRRKHEQRIEKGSRAHYLSKWGGAVNHERFTIPFDPESAQDGVTNPDLQRHVQRDGSVENAIDETLVEATTPPRLMTKLDAAQAGLNPDEYPF